MPKSMNDYGSQNYESMDDIIKELRYGCPCRDICSYLHSLADRIEVAHASGVIKAMDDLMRG